MPTAPRTRNDGRRLGRETDWAIPRYGRLVIGLNDRVGLLKEYQPVVHDLTREQFEALGAPFAPDKIPAWEGQP